MTKQSIIYCRFSPRPKECPQCGAKVNQEKAVCGKCEYEFTDEDSCTSNERQEERCRAYCERKSYEVSGVFADANVSGKTLNRPGLSAALAALQPGMVLVVDRNDRLARDMLVGLTILQRVEDRGATIEFADGSPLHTTPEGRLFQNVMGAVAQYQREVFARNTQSGLARKRAAGMWLGKPPVGFELDRETKRLVPHDMEQKAIQWARVAANTVGSAEEIAAELTQRFGSFRGRAWSARTVKKILARK